MHDLKLTAVQKVRRILGNWDKKMPRSACVKHWAVILFLHDPIDKCDLTPLIIEANRNNDGKLLFELSNWEGDLKREWEGSDGFHIMDFELEEKEHTYPHGWLKNYIAILNDMKTKYNCIFENCHKFVLNLLCDLNLAYLTKDLEPMSAEYTFNRILGSSIPRSTFNRFRRDIPKLLSTLNEDEIDSVARFSWENSIFPQTTDPGIEMPMKMIFVEAALKSVKLSKKNPKLFNGSDHIPPWHFIHWLVVEIDGRFSDCLADLIASTVESESVPSHDMKGIASFVNNIGEAISFVVRLIHYASSKSATKNKKGKLEKKNEQILSFYHLCRKSMPDGTIKRIRNETEHIKSTFEDEAISPVEVVNSIFYK